MKDELARLPWCWSGAGVRRRGLRDAALAQPPNKVAARGLTAGDVVNAVRAQNIEVAAGGVGQQPVAGAVAFELVINAQGQSCVTEEEFGSIIVKTGERGEVVKLRDVARVDFGSGEYALRSLINNKAAVGIPVFQLPGARMSSISPTVSAPAWWN